VFILHGSVEKQQHFNWCDVKS